MKFEKSPPWLIELFAAQMEGVPADNRKMFGYPCAFVKGQMFTGLFASTMIVRLPEEGRAELLAVEGAQVFDPMGGRPMREYVVLPQAMLEDEEEVHRWVERAFAYASSLPPKTRLKAKKVAVKKAAPKRRGK